MTNKELQEKLKEYPDDYPVTTASLTDSVYYNIVEIDLIRNRILLVQE